MAMSSKKFEESRVPHSLREWLLFYSDKTLDDLQKEIEEYGFQHPEEKSAILAFYHNVVLPNPLPFYKRLETMNTERGVEVKDESGTLLGTTTGSAQDGSMEMTTPEGNVVEVFGRGYIDGHIVCAECFFAPTYLRRVVPEHVHKPDIRTAATQILDSGKCVIVVPANEQCRNTAYVEYHARVVAARNKRDGTNLWIKFVDEVPFRVGKSSWECAKQIMC